MKRRLKLHKTTRLYNFSFNNVMNENYTISVEYVRRPITIMNLKNANLYINLLKLNFTLKQFYHIRLEALIKYV